MCNGTRLRLTHIGRFILEGQILGGERHRGKATDSARILMNTTEGELPWIVNRKQFPIRLCPANDCEEVARPVLGYSRS